MCGFVGIWAKNSKGEAEFSRLSDALESISHRGPDHQGIKLYSKVALGHRRLSIIDTNERSNQPFTSDDGEFALIFNGEIYNYEQLRDELEQRGVEFKTHSDTEVLFHLLKLDREKALSRLNGFFSFVFYDHYRNEILFARDRMGIKPMLMYEDGDKIILSSEFQSLFEFNLEKEINPAAINHYLGLTYIPAPHTLIERGFKIEPGHYGIISEDQVTITPFSEVRRNPYLKLTYTEAKSDLQRRLYKAVEDRLVADVPLGSFLSGGIDSSIISTIAAEIKPDLQTFSVGFDHEYFDETKYAEMVANKIKSNHTTITLDQDIFNAEFDNFLNALDEPFADSSAFATYLLAKKTKEHVTVALSGDGADELFGGYNKHRALLKSLNISRRDRFLVNTSSGLLKVAGVNRSTKFGQFNRKIQKLNSGLKLDLEARYWHWCHFASIDSVVNILKPEHYRTIDWEGYMVQDVSDSLIADQQFILPNDMLKKVDSMSMAHSLEVRTPFLDHQVVDFANSIPLDYKLNEDQGKIILKETFDKMLPTEILNRNKKGFEIPLSEWLGDKISSILQSDLFSESFIEQQGIYDYEGVKNLIKRFGSNRFGDNMYLVWSLIIFQHWWKKNMVDGEN